MKLEDKSIARQKTYGKIRRNFAGWILLVPTVFLLIFVVIKPLYMGIINSFYDLVGFTPKEFIGLENYIQVIKDTKFIGTLGNTFLYVLWSLIIGLPLPFICAIMLN